MRVVLLGTGDSPGTPVIGCHCQTCEDARKNGWERKRFSVLVQNEGRNILVDTSPDMRTQLLRMNVDKVDAVIWTHCHYDHFAGFGDFYRVQSNVNVYTSPEVHEDIGRFMFFMKYRPFEVEAYEPFKIFGLEFTLFDVNHPPLRRAHGVVIRKGGIKVVVSGDTNSNIPQRSIKEMMNPDLFIVDAIAPAGYKLKKHMNASEALSLAKKIKAKKVVFTHVGHFYPPKSDYPLGYDFQTFSFEEQVTLDDYWD
ncbi:ATP-binding protein PhnP (PhnP) [Ferroglobus placidus DSM 10642]|uniref:ATP-binding protein PhnP (PhnP) n=1 Tax=Ferroglobus placidus (strain DSM 10642 / AEDII12DO) TaxID=589924 RepID=D3RWX5_FERPA|nr:MBL fold metallo-hydrolase [Ferroglobus placidus]ADC64988.1 ATP-binding protein PhnP (PhnP) [Ferroglobus placidus DSM 10642]